MDSGSLSEDVNWHNSYLGSTFQLGHTENQMCELLLLCPH